MVLLGYQLAHARAANPVTKINCVLIAIVVVEHSEPFDQKRRQCYVWKLMPFALIPKVRDAAQKRALKLVDTPEWFHSDNLAIWQPSLRLAEATHRIRRLPNLK